MTCCSRILTDGALLERLRREDGFAGYGVHGLRSTYRDWGGDETDFPREVLEGAYGHVITTGSERAYRRSKPLYKHREVFRDWLAFRGTRPHGPPIRRGGIRSPRRTRAKAPRLRN